MKSRTLYLAGAKGMVEGGRVLVPRAILRVGLYRSETGPWAVTRADLEEIHRSYWAGHCRGIDCPVTVGLSDDVRDRVGRFGSLDLRGDSLWAVLALRSNAAARVQHLPDIRVEVREGFVDGQGNEYRLALVNVGLVPLGEGSKLLSRF